MLKSPRILVVEDSLEDFETIADAVKATNIPLAIVHALDAFEAARLIENEREQLGSFALMILDYNLPGKNGREFLLEFSKTPDRYLTPVIIFTTSSNLVECQQCYEAGANAFHTKPIRYKDYLQMLNGIFHYWLNVATVPLCPGRNN